MTLLAAVRVSARYPFPETSDVIEGLVFVVPRPLRHDAAIRAATAALRLDRVGEHEQGFALATTDSGLIFLTREEAASHAYLSGAINRRLSSLTTESLW